jgi:hypothetical protein
LDDTGWELPLAGGDRRNRRYAGHPEAVNQRFDGGEKESPIFADATAQDSSELIPPEWRDLLVSGSKKFLASRFEFRKNSNKEPCISLVPERVTALTMPPASAQTRPNTNW